ncbi:MAG: transglutaminase domain-containing protein, partial [Clostridia bacterium]|nr:transglutaminase domain-containing protein [Clostridia bacterium]
LSPIHSQFFDCPTSDCLPNPYIQQRSYTVNFFSYSGYNIYSAIPNEFKNAEQLYRNHVKNHYLSLPQSTNAQVTDFLNDNGIYAGDKDCIEKVFDLLSEYTYDIYYDQALDNESDVVISFLTEYKEGICQHFASSATVMFRAVGIPARYVGGLYAGNLLANQETVLTANSAHAWVEIYKDGVGWIRLDPTSVAIVENALPSGSYPSSDYKEGNSNEGSGDGDSSGGGSGGGSGGNSGDSSTGGSGDSSTDSSNDSSSNSSTSSNSSNSSSSSSSSSSSNSSSSESSSSTSQPDTSNENCSSKDIPWQTIAIVGSALMVSAIVVALIALLRKTKKKIKVRRKQETQDEILPEEVATLAIDEETRIATEIIRENYKEFIKIAGKNGIRKYPKDTTQSLRNKYSYAIGPNQAMEILTQLYRIARYNKNERLTMDDANQSKLCLDIIKQSFANPESKTEDGDKE